MDQLPMAPLGAAHVSPGEKAAQEEKEPAGEEGQHMVCTGPCLEASAGRLQCCDGLVGQAYHWYASHTFTEDLSEKDSALEVG